jgi:phosphoglucomutase
MAFDYRELEKQAQKEYERWMEETEENPRFHRELEALQGNEEEITDAFYKPLRFGTSGLRGILGPGTNRINLYTVRRSSQGLSDYLNKTREDPSVIVSYDSRRQSRFLAEETAAVLNGNGIRTFIFGELTPVSVLSFAIREMKADMGVMITASHNPKIYNGYKVYNSEGYQVIGDEPGEILKAIDRLDYFSGIKYKKDGGIKKVPGKIKDSFIRKIADDWMPLNSEMMNHLKTIYTPLNGTGAKYVPSVFNCIGYLNHTIVRAQEYPDPEFTTCPAPNPEKILAYDEGFKALDQEGGDIIIATDPDADRAGAALYHDGMRSILTGNQLGILMLDYLCHIRPPREDQFVVKSIATSPMVSLMAEKYGFTVINTLTGFRYIGDIVSRLKQAGQEDRFYFGFEESNSFLISPFLCEKDGISASVLIAEVAAFHKSQGKDLVDRLNELYQEFGVCSDKQRSYVFSGARGQETMKKIMQYFRQNESDKFGDRRVERRIDYMHEEGFPSADVVEYDFDDGSRLIIRPSGTEAKLKVYSFETCDFSGVEREVVRIIERFKEV